MHVDKAKLMKDREQEMMCEQEEKGHTNTQPRTQAWGEISGHTTFGAAPESRSSTKCSTEVVRKH